MYEFFREQLSENRQLIWSPLSEHYSLFIDISVHRQGLPPLLTRIAKKQRIKLSFILTQKKSSARNCATNIFFCTVKKTKSSLFLQQGNYSTKKIYGPIKENSLSVPSYWGILSMTLNDKSVSTIKVNEFMRNSPLENEKPRIIKNKCLSKKYISGIWKHLTKLHQIDSKN